MTTVAYFEIKAERDAALAREAVLTEALEAIKVTVITPPMTSPQAVQLLDMKNIARKALANPDARAERIMAVVEAWQTMTDAEREYVAEHLRTFVDQGTDLANALDALAEAVDAREITP